MSNHQLFKLEVPLEIIWNFFNKVMVNFDKYLLLDKASFKKAEFNNLISPFYNELKDYYHSSKKYYVERKITYPSFITIIRQLCKTHKIVIISKIKYNKSKYDMEYHIYKPFL
jgi:hypothetical protein